MRGEKRKTPCTSSSGACEAALGGPPGPLRPQTTVCLLPSLEVTHPPAGTMATGKQSHPCGSSNSCGLGREGQAPSTPTAPVWASLCPLGLHPTSPQAPTGPTSPHSHKNTLGWGWGPTGPSSSAQQQQPCQAQWPQGGSSCLVASLRPPCRDNGRGKVDNLGPSRVLGLTPEWVTTPLFCYL